MTITVNKDRRCRIAEACGVPPAWQAALLAIVMSAAGYVNSATAADVSQREVHAKMTYCEVCHGSEARGFVGYYPIPRLAGQQVEYIENQLRGFVEHKRASTASPATTNIMFNVGHVLSPAMIKALATSFHDLNPKPVGGAPKENVAAGKKIFDEGVAGTNIPPCASCHGQDGKGSGPIPRLAGQLYPYVVKQLTNWSKERAEENADVMAPIAHELTKPQVEAVAAYVSSLE